MKLDSDLALSVTKKKLQSLQERYNKLALENGGDEYLRGLTMRSLKKMINQMIEEITLYEIHAGATHK
jgi:hypothetical protein